MTYKDKTFCRSNDCPYTRCERHPIQLTEPGMFSLGDFYKTCTKYLNWLSYSNYIKYAEIKGASNE